MRSLPSYSVKLEHMWESKSPGIWSTLRQLIEGKKFACASCERQLLVATSLSNHQPFALPTFLCYTYRSFRKAYDATLSHCRRQKSRTNGISHGRYEHFSCMHV